MSRIGESAIRPGSWVLEQIRLTSLKLYVLIFSDLSVPLTWLRRTSRRSSISAVRRRSSKRERRTRYALSRFCDAVLASQHLFVYHGGGSRCGAGRTSCCERESCIETVMPVGMWVRRIADSVLLTCCKCKEYTVSSARNKDGVVKKGLYSPARPRHASA